MITDQHRQSITDFITRVGQAIHVPCKVALEEETRNGRTVIVASVHADEHAHLLIGKNGQNLQALEHILRAVVLKDAPESPALVVDVNDYKKQKSLQVIDLARQAVTKVRSTRKAEALAPMSPYERRIVHMELASVTDVATESIGQEPHRRIVIKPL